MALDYLSGLFSSDDGDEEYDLGLAEQYVENALYVEEINPDKDVKKFYHDHSKNTEDNAILDSQSLNVLESSAQFILPSISEMENPPPLGREEIPVYMRTRHRRPASTEGIEAVYMFELGNLRHELVKNKFHTPRDSINEIGLQKLFKRKSVGEEIEEAYQEATENE
jgi:hypothetical protein